MLVASHTNPQFFTNASNAEKEQLHCSTAKVKVRNSCFCLGNVSVGAPCFSGTVAMQRTSLCSCLHIFTEEVPDP